MVLPPEFPFLPEEYYSLPSPADNTHAWNIILQIIVQDLELQKTLPEGEYRKGKVIQEATHVVRLIIQKLYSKSDIFGIPQTAIFPQDGTLYANGTIEIPLAPEILSFPKGNREKMIEELEIIAQEYHCKASFHHQPPKPPKIILFNPEFRI